MKKLLQLIMFCALAFIFSNCVSSDDGGDDLGDLGFKIDKITLVDKDGDKIATLNEDTDEVEIDENQDGDKLEIIVKMAGEFGSVVFDEDNIINYDEDDGEDQFFKVITAEVDETYEITIQAFAEEDGEGDSTDKIKLKFKLVTESSDKDSSSEDKESSSSEDKDDSSSSEDKGDSSSSEDKDDSSSSEDKDDSSSSEDDEDSSSSETGGDEPPKHVFFNEDEGISKNLRLMTGDEIVDEGSTLTIDQSDNAGGGPMFLLTEDEDDFETTDDYSEYKTLLIKAKSSEDLVVTIYTGAPATGTAGSCGARDGPDCSYIQLTIPASDQMVETAITFANETPANAEFTMEKFRMLAIWAPGKTVTEYEYIEFQSDAVAFECPIKDNNLQKLEPPHCKTMITVGQFNDATLYFNDSEIPPPAGAMTYMTSSGAWLNWDVSFVIQEKMVLQIGLSLKDNCAPDPNSVLNSLNGWEGVPVYIRVAYEFDNEHNCSPDQIKSAFANFKNATSNMPNIAIVWHTSGYNHGQDTRDHLESFWPGDNNVDWIGVSYFGYNFEHKINMMNEVIKYAQGKNKPIMLGEVSLTDVNDAGYSQNNVWDRFFMKGLHALSSNFENRIKMISFIHSNWPANGWSTPFDANTLFTDPNSNVGAHKQDWIDLIHAKDSKNMYVNQDDLTINSDGTFSVK